MVYGSSGWNQNMQCSIVSVVLVYGLLCCWWLCLWCRIRFCLVGLKCCLKFGLIIMCGCYRFISVGRLGLFCVCQLLLICGCRWLSVCLKWCCVCQLVVVIVSVLVSYVVNSSNGYIGVLVDIFGVCSVVVIFFIGVDLVIGRFGNGRYGIISSIGSSYQLWYVSVVLFSFSSIGCIVVSISMVIDSYMLVCNSVLSSLVMVQFLDQFFEVGDVLCVQFVMLVEVCYQWCYVFVEYMFEKVFVLFGYLCLLLQYGCVVIVVVVVVGIDGFFGQQVIEQCFDGGFGLVVIGQGGYYFVGVQWMVVL